MPWTDEQIYEFIKRRTETAVEQWLGDDEDDGCSDYEFYRKFLRIAEELIRARGPRQ